jgi:REP-associated tyrosine transposase
MADTYHRLSPSRWHCQSPGGCVPNRRRKTLEGPLRKALGALVPARARQQAGHSLAGHVMPAHVPRGSQRPPQPAGAAGSGLLKGKRALALARPLAGRERHCTGEHCGVRGAAVSTVGFELEQVRAYIRAQAAADEAGRLSSTTQRGRATAFEAALLIKPPALPGVSDFVLPHVSLRLALAEPERIEGTGGVKKWRQRTPAMAAGLANRVWSLREVLMWRVPPWLQP